MSYDKEQAAKLLAGLPAHLVQHFPVRVHTIDGPLDILSVYRVEGVLTVDVEQPPAAAPTWNGPQDGLPPVGLEVEARFPQSILSGWTRFTLMYLSEQTLVYKTLNEVSCAPAAFERQNVQFRPIHTAEQLAAEERERGVDELMKWANSLSGAFYQRSSFRLFWQSAYDKGLRAPVKP